MDLEQRPKICPKIINSYRPFLSPIAAGCYRAILLYETRVLITRLYKPYVLLFVCISIHEAPGQARTKTRTPMTSARVIRPSSPAVVAYTETLRGSAGNFFNFRSQYVRKCNFWIGFCNFEISSKIENFMKFSVMSADLDPA